MITRTLLSAAVTTSVLATAAAHAGADGIPLTAPANDLFSGATRVGVDYSTTTDTRAATTGDTDEAANRHCGAPATDASVWYQLTPATDQTVILQSRGSSYSVGFIVVTGSPAAFRLQACGPRNTMFVARAGTLYSILAFDDQEDGVGNGGSLHFATKLGPPPPSLSVTVDPHALIQKTARALTVTGTFTCADARAMFTRFDARQRAGRFFVQGSKSLKHNGSVCNGTPQVWAVVITGNGRFAGGKATVTARGEVCSNVTCTVTKVQQVIQIRG